MRLPECLRNLMIELLKRDAKARSERAPIPEPAADPILPELPQPLQKWLSEAVGQMRWKRARPCAGKELYGHLSDQYNAFIEQGLDEEAAAAATIKEMGDPIETGTRLDRAWRPKPDWVTLGMTLIIAAAGIIMQYLFRVPERFVSETRWYVFAVKYIVGAAVLLGAYFLDYTLLGRYGNTLYRVWLAGGIFILLFPGTNTVVMGAVKCLRQWVMWFPMVFAGFLYSQRGRGFRGIGNCLLTIASMCVLCLLAPYTGAMVLMVFVCCVILACSVMRGVFGEATKLKMLAAVSPLVLGILGLFQLVMNLPHVREKLHVILDPSLDPEGAGYWGAMIQNIMLGRYVSPEINAEAERYMTEIYDCVDNFMLVKIKYEWGWIAFALVIAALVLLLARGLRIVKRQTGLLGWCVSLTAVLVLSTEVLVYVIQNFGITAYSTTGLPLLSYGGVYLCQTMFIIGLLLSTQRMGDAECGIKKLSVTRA